MLKVYTMYRTQDIILCASIINIQCGLQGAMFPNGNQQYIPLDICYWPFHFTIYLLWCWLHIVSSAHVKCVPMEIKETNGKSFQNSFHFSPMLALPDISLSTSGAPFTNKV